ncbi:MAG: hypothetical protein ABUK01_10685 [Leptospirales bacterium]
MHKFKTSVSILALSVFLISQITHCSRENSTDIGPVHELGLTSSDLQKGEFVEQEFDPAKAKIFIAIDAKALTDPSDPEYYPPVKLEKKGARGEKIDESKFRANMATDKPVICKDMTASGNKKSGDKCLKKVDKVILSIQKIELLIDDLNSISVLEHEEPEAYVLNRLGETVVEVLVEPKVYTGIKITLANGHAVEFSDTTVLNASMHKVDHPVTTHKIEAKAGFITDVKLAFDKTKITHYNNLVKIEALLRYRDIDLYEAAYSIVSQENLSDEDDNELTIALPLNVEQTATELARLKSQMASKTFISENPEKPSMYHVMIYVDKPEHKTLLDTLQIHYDYFPLFDTDDIGLGMIDIRQHTDGFFVYALITDFHYNLFMAFKLFQAFEVLDEVSYETLAKGGFHMRQLYEPTEAELDIVDRLFDEQILAGVVVFPTAQTTVGTLSVGQRGFFGNLWNGIRRATSRVGRIVANTVRAVLIVVDVVLSTVVRGLAFVTSGFQSAKVRGRIGFSDKQLKRYRKFGKPFLLKKTPVTIRANGFFLNASFQKSDSKGYFNSGALATNFFGAKIRYNVRIRLENDVATIYNGNPLWPITLVIGSSYANNKIKNYHPKEPNLFVYGVTNFAHKRAKNLFQYTDSSGGYYGPKRALIVTGNAGILQAIMESQGTDAMVPAGTLGSIVAGSGITIGSFFGPSAAALGYAIASLVSWLFQLDADIYFLKKVRFNESVIVHEYGHYVMFDKIIRNSSGNSVKGLLYWYLKNFDRDAYSKDENLVQFVEGWADFFAYIALSTKDKNGAWEVAEPKERISKGYFVLPELTFQIDNLTGLEINLGGTTAAAESVYPEVEQGWYSTGRVAAILYDLYDSKQDTDANSSLTDRVELKPARILKLVTGLYSKDRCTILDGCKMDLNLLYLHVKENSAYYNNKYNLNFSDFSKIYRMHGISTSLLNSGGYYTLSNYNKFQTMPITPLPIIMGPGITSTELVWQADVTADYFIQKSGDCLNGMLSTGTGAEGFITPDQTVTSTLLRSDMQPGVNTVTICVYAESAIEYKQITVITDVDAPTTMASPGSISFGGNPVWVSLHCTDTGGAGCSKMVYTKDGTEPSFSPLNGTLVDGDTAAFDVRCDVTLKFRSMDLAGNTENSVTESYANGADCCNDSTLCKDETNCKDVKVTTKRSGCWKYYGWPINASRCICGTIFRPESCYVAKWVPECTIKEKCNTTTTCNY